MELSMVLLKRYLPLDGNNHEWPQIMSIVIASISTLNAGIVFAWPSPSIPELLARSSEFHISFEEASYFPVLPPLAMAISAPLFSNIVDKIGRRPTIMLMVVPQFLSWLLIALGERTSTFYLSRAIAGIGDAVNLMVGPLYIAEISQPKVRRRWANALPLASFFGQFAANLFGSYLSIREAACMYMVLPVLQAFLVIFIPESPYFLIMKNRCNSAKKSLQFLLWKEDVEEELAGLTRDVQRQISESGSLADLFVGDTSRRALKVAIGLRASQAFSGFAAFMVYTQYMFEQVGSGVSKTSSATMFSGFMFLVITASVFLADRCCRRTLMITSCLGSGITLTLVSFYLYLQEYTNIDLDRTSWIPLAGLFVFVLTFSTGLGIVPLIMLGELFSASVKAKAMCVINMAFGCFVIVSSKMYQVLSENVSVCAAFSVFAGCCFAGAVFSYRSVPETRGKTLEEIQQGFRKDVGRDLTGSEL